MCSSLKIGKVIILSLTSNEAVLTWFSCTSIFSVASSFASVDFLFAVQFNDGLYIHHGTHATLRHLQITFGGRTDRNDPEDIEPVVHIPVKALFTKL